MNVRQVLACPGQCVRRTGIFMTLALVCIFAPVLAMAAPYAAYVIDARTGQVLHEENAYTKLHPASLTKMMTLYIAFEAIERGEISLDSKVTISKHAASEPASKLGLKAGQTIALRYLIRAAAIKSANDAATAIGEAIEGSEAAFARRMTRTAKALGMKKTTFANANGLTAKGHLSTAYDMTMLGRHLFYDYPQYYNLFSRTSADAGMAKVASTNRRFLAAYRGADGIKTGYTSAAGFNLVASAQRGNKRIIATVFGGKSTAGRNARVAELLDMGFGKAPNRATVQKPARPLYAAVADETEDTMDGKTGGSGKVSIGKTLRVNVAVLQSPRPRPRPVLAIDAPSDDLLAEMQKSIDAVLAEAQADPAPVADTAVLADAAMDLHADDAVAVAPEAAIAVAGAEPSAPEGSDTTAPAEVVAFEQTTAPQPETLAAMTAAPDGELVATTPTIADAAEETPDPFTTATANAPTSSLKPLRSPQRLAVVEVPVETELAAAMPEPVAVQPEPPVDVADALEGSKDNAPGQAPSQIVLEARADDVDDISQDALEVVTRVSTSGGRQWAINVGHFGSRYNAERQLLQTALIEMNTLDEALRKVVGKRGGFDANFVGMTQETAELACRRLQARQTECTVVGP
ncbi:MAG: serine hydrolase [Albidovulum sp.]